MKRRRSQIPVTVSGELVEYVEIVEESQNRCTRSEEKEGGYLKRPRNLKSRVAKEVEYEGGNRGGERK